MHALQSLQILYTKGLRHERRKNATKGWGLIKFVDSLVHAYNCFRLYLPSLSNFLFAICMSLYDSLDKNMTILIKTKD